MGDNDKIETLNKFMVGVQGKSVVMLRPVPQKLTPEDAMLLAAYLVSMAEMDSTVKFEDVLNAVQST